LWTVLLYCKIIREKQATKKSDSVIAFTVLISKLGKNETEVKFPSKEARDSFINSLTDGKDVFYGQSPHGTFKENEKFPRLKDDLTLRILAYISNPQKLVGAHQGEPKLTPVFPNGFIRDKFKEILNLRAESHKSLI
jgi:hypothetical protein